MVLTVIAINDAPTASDLAYTVAEDGTLVVEGAVMDGAYDADGDVLTAEVVSEPASGVLAMDPDGSFTYTPGADFNGSDRFTYQLSDGQLTSSVAEVTFTVRSASDAPVATGGQLRRREERATDGARIGGCVGQRPPTPTTSRSRPPCAPSQPTARWCSGRTEGSITPRRRATWASDQFTYVADDGTATSDPTHGGADGRQVARVRVQHEPHVVGSVGRLAAARRDGPPPPGVASP